MLVYFFRIKRIVRPLNQYSKLEEMLTLRALGASYTTLATRYGVTKDNIAHLCQRFGLGGKMNPPVSTTRKKPMILYNERNEVINRGKSYADYLREDNERKWRSLKQTASSSE